MNERVTSMRDLLNKLISLECGDDIDAEVIRCALACSVEELEKFIYDGKMTPSVKPAEQNITYTTTGKQSGTDPIPARIASQLDIAAIRDNLSTPERLCCLNGSSGVEDAVKSFMQRTGTDITKAREYVYAYVERCLKLTDAEKVQFRGNKIAAIKVIRERSGLGLFDAKKYVETYNPF